MLYYIGQIDNLVTHTRLINLIRGRPSILHIYDVIINMHACSQPLILELVKGDSTSSYHSTNIGSTLLGGTLRTLELINGVQALLGDQAHA
jgi:hypothetical protein